MEIARSSTDSRGPLPSERAIASDGVFLLQIDRVQNSVPPVAQGCVRNVIAMWGRPGAHLLIDGRNGVGYHPPVCENNHNLRAL